MRLSFVFELLLIFVLLAFAASKAIGKSTLAILSIHYNYANKQLYIAITRSFKNGSGDAEFN